MDIDKLAKYILQQYPGKPFSFFEGLKHDDNIIKNIAMYMANSISYQNRQKIIKVFQRNTGKIQKYFITDEIESKLTVAKKRSMVDSFYSVVENWHFEVKELEGSCSSDTSVYGKICKLMQMKNCLKNRLKLKQRWVRSRNQLALSKCSNNTISQIPSDAAS